MKDIDKILSGSDKLKSAISDINDKILSIKREVEDNKNVSDTCDNIINTNKKIIRELSNGNDLVKKLEDRKNEFKKGYTYYKDAYDELFPKFEELFDENGKLKKENKNLKKENKTNDDDDEEEEPAKVVKKITIEGKIYLVDKQTNEVYDYDIYKAEGDEVIIGKYDPKTNKITMKKSSKK